MGEEKSRVPFEESLAALGVLGAALLVRLWALGSSPLEPGEATLALAAQAWMHRQSVPVVSVPLAPLWQGVLFFLMEPNTFWARFWPAFLGASLAVLPWLYFPKAPRIFRIVLGMALALDPVLVIAARAADGPMWAVPWVLLTLWAASTGRMALAVLAGVLALAMGRHGWIGALLLSLTGLWLWRFHKLAMPKAFTIRPLPPEKRAWVLAGLWLGLLGLGLYVQGLVAAFVGLAELPKLFHPQWPLKSLAIWVFLAYQAPLWAAWVLGRLSGLHRDAPMAARWGVLLAAITTVLWLLLPGREPAWAIWVNLGLWPMVAWMLLQLRPFHDLLAWGLTGLHLALWGFLWSLAPSLLAEWPLLGVEPTATLRLALAALALWLIVLGYAIARFSLPARAATHHALLAWFVLTLGFSMSGWARVYGPRAHQLWARETTADDVNRLVETWSQWALWTHGRPETLNGLSLTDDPVLRWALRDKPVEWIPYPVRPLALLPEGVLTASNQDFPWNTSIAYRGAVFRVRVRVLPFATWQEGMLWWLHQNPPRTETQRAVLWLREDVFFGK